MRKWFFIALMVFGSVWADTAFAQVPSIPRQSQSAKKSADSHYVAWGTEYDWLSTRYATYNDIRHYDKGQIRVLKNSIYARHGRKFKDKELRAYFSSLDWYRPIYDEVPARFFNKYENANIAFLKKYE